MTEVPSERSAEKVGPPSLADVRAKVQAFRGRITARFGDGFDFGWQRRITGNFSVLVVPSGTGFRSFMAESGLDIPIRNVMDGQDTSGQSELKLNQTGGQFLAAVDGALVKHKVNVEEIQGLPEEKKAAVIVDAYLELLAMGYTAGDLMGTLDMSNIDSAKID